MEVLLEKNLIKDDPIKKTTNMDVNIAKPVLNVRYLKTLRNEYWLINSKIKL